MHKAQRQSNINLLPSGTAGRDDDPNPNGPSKQRKPTELGPSTGMAIAIYRDTSEQVHRGRSAVGTLTACGPPEARDVAMAQSAWRTPSSASWRCSFPWDGRNTDVNVSPFCLLSTGRHSAAYSPQCSVGSSTTPTPLEPQHRSGPVHPARTFGTRAGRRAACSSCQPRKTR